MKEIQMSDNFLDSLLGLTNEAAVIKITNAGYLPAMGSNSPSSQPPITVIGGPMMNRVNIVLTNNVVTKAYFG